MKLDMEFSKEFESWLASALAPEIPSIVVAFSFNIFELDSAQANYGIELVGCDEFDAGDSDWACGEVWVASPRSIFIPRGFVSGGWEACLHGIEQLVLSVMEKSSVAAKKLKEAKAVAVGFVDGDLKLIWQR